MPVTTEQNGISRVVCLEGTVNISCAGELKSLLMEALSERQPLSIRLERITDLDVCTVQLLVAAVREWKQIGVSCTLVGPLKEEISQNIADAGFESFPMTIDAAVSSEA